jgi:hypothetical protein
MVGSMAEPSRVEGGYGTMRVILALRPKPERTTGETEVAR